MIDEALSLKNRLSKAKDICNIFKRLSNEGYNIKTGNIKFFEYDYFKTHIENKSKYIFIDVVWRPHTEPETSNGFKQEVAFITY